MTLLAFLAIINACAFVFFGVMIRRQAPKEPLSRMAARTNICFAIWSFSSAFLYLAETADEAMFWHRIGAFGWAMFSAYATHFFMILSGRSSRMNPTLLHLLIYTLPVILLAKSLFDPAGSSVASGFERSAGGFGWVYVLDTASFWYWLYIVHMAVYFTVSLFLTWFWAVESGKLRHLKQARSIIVLDVAVLIVGGAWDLLLPLFNRSLPPACNLIAFIWGLGFYLIVMSLKFMSAEDAATPDIILRTVMDPILVLDREGIILKCNQATQRMLKRESGDILNHRLSDFFRHGAEVEGFDMKLLDGGQLRFVDLDLVDADGRTINARASFSVAESKLDGPVGIVANLHDVTLLKSVENELSISNDRYRTLLGHMETLAKQDSLTGLPNRRMLIEKVDVSVRDFARRNARFAMLFIDLDGFKGVNDQYGHEIGDLLLQKVADVFSESIRKSDMVARVGGDEFILFIDLDDDRNGDAIVDGLVRRMERIFAAPFDINGCACRIGISIGISRFPEDGATGDALTRTADQRMYLEKMRHRAQSKVE